MLKIFISRIRWKIYFEIFFCLIVLTNAISIDNDIIGEPDIECLDKEIRVWIKTRKYFVGRIYAKGKADEDGCFKSDFATANTKKPHFDLNLGMCGMKSLRSFDPRGMYYGITLVVSFHPTFITKVDQAFHVKCFFEEANRGLTAELGVSMIPTTEVEARHGIPGCTYSIHKSSIDDLDAGKPPGPPIQFAKVGDKVLHQWHCDDQMFGVLINNCYVTDGVKERADVVDSRGCPVDPLLVTGVRYSDDMQRAYAESQVFKFADRPGIWFFCQVQMCMKKEGMCDGITPPACAGSSVSTSKSSFGSHLLATTDGDDDLEVTTAPKFKKTKKLNRSHETIDEEVEDYSNEDYNNKETYQSKKKKNKKVNYETDEDDGNEKTINKSHQKPRINHPYGVPNPSPDYDFHAKEPVSVFGPGIAPGAGNKNSVVSSGLEESAGKKTGSEIVSTEFETDDDLTTANLEPNPSTVAITTTIHPKTGKRVNKDSVKKDYVDYDNDVTIPTNLQDLLANLPENINADNLQKMFRDSVDDRRALLQGFDMLINKMTKDEKVSETSMPKPPESQKQILKKSSGRMMPGDKIDTMHVTWESQRMARDLPISTDSKVPFGTPDPNGPPMIAGQLLIYDLDETPPNAVEEEAVREEQQRECAISRHGLMVVAMALGSVALACIFVIFILSLKLRTKSKNLLLNSSFGSLPSISKSVQSSNYSNVSVYRQPLTKNDSSLCQRRLN